MILTQNPSSSGTSLGICLFAGYSVKRLKLTIKSLTFSAGVDEPLFCSLSLHDLRSKTKITEQFFFEQFSPQWASFVALHCDGKPESPLSSSKSCLFHLPPSLPSDSVYVILRINKIRSSDLDRDTTLYLKPKTVKKAVVSKLENELQGLVDSNDAYLMPFLWGGFTLSSIENTPSGAELEVDDFHLYKNYTQDDYIYECLQKELDSGKVWSFRFTLF